jgi:transcriptional regulator with XRE-family HTH domain
VDIGRNIARNAQTLRQRQGLSLEQLAEKVEMIPRGIEALERGDCEISAARLHRIADVLGVEPRSLVWPPRTAA